MRVKNRKTIKNLSDKSFQAARLRNGIAMVAIALTALLFTSLFTIGLGCMESFQYMTARQAGGDAQGTFKYLSRKEYDKIKTHPLIKTITYNRLIADSVDNPEFLKRHVEMYQMDQAGRETGFIPLPEEQAPKKADEIAMDTKSLDLLGIPHKIGEKVTLQMTIHKKQVTREFTLCGFWESDPLLNVGYGLVSPAYCEKYEKELSEVDFEDPANANSCLAGCINSYVNFSNSFQIQKKLDQVLEESGFSTDEQSDQFIASNANWAYMSTNFDGDPAAIGAVGGILLLIMLTGYLIIYNIFQISVIRDIRFYGLLKTIGTTGKQMKAMIHRQALKLSLGGIPLGLILGFFLGKLVVPKFMALSSYGLEESKVGLNPMIFIGATIFTLLTVLISVRKPGKIAASVSPVEAVRYVEGEKYRKKAKRSTDGGKIYRMALSNLGRNKKKTILVFLSLSLSVILLNSVFTISRGFDMDKYLATFVDTDFLIGNANYFNMEHYWGLGEPEEQISGSFIEAVKSQPGYKNGGTWYLDSSVVVEDFDFKGYEKEKNGYKRSRYGVSNFYISTDEKDRPYSNLYGADDFLLGRMELADAQIPVDELKEKLDSGKYILEGIALDDNGREEWQYTSYKKGEKVTLLNPKTGKKHTYEVLAHIKVKYWTNSNRMSNNFPFYTSRQGYRLIGSTDQKMSFAYNVEKSQQKAMADFLKNYTEQVEPTMDYETKFTKEAEFKQMQLVFVGVGGALSFVIGLIGILNFINSILTGIITRRREFAMLESIGMTKRQLTKMVLLEGIYYALGTIEIAVTGGMLVSVFVVKNLLKTFWFFTYKMIFWPLLAAIPVVLLLGILVPYFARKMAGEGALVERLREVE